MNSRLADSVNQETGLTELVYGVEGIHRTNFEPVYFFTGDSPVFSPMLLVNVNRQM